MQAHFVSVGDACRDADADDEPPAKVARLDSGAGSGSLAASVPYSSGYYNPPAIPIPAPSQ